MRSLFFQVFDQAKEAELLLWRTVLPDMFIRLEVETSTRCNRRCAFCPVAAAPREDRLMPEPLFLSILEQAAEMGFRGRFSPHFFGEPLLDPRLPRLLAEARRRLPRARIVLYTNGDLLSPERARLLLDVGVDLFLVTVEDREGPALLRTRQESDLRRRVLVRHFYEDVRQPFNRGGAIRFQGQRRQRRSCHASASTLVVDAEGQVRLCFNDYEGSVIWGDLKRERLAAIWRKPAYVRHRRALLTGGFEARTCLECAGIVPASHPLMDHP